MLSVAPLLTRGFLPLNSSRLVVQTVESRI
jgi:hypothetical protein